MRLNRIELSNFRQHADTRIEFDSGLTGILGPNGAGKSTILEAIAWAIYGNAAARGKRESIRFNRAPARSGVRVDLEFELGGHRYRVVRGLTSAELYLDGAPVPIANSITGVTELLTHRLGMTREEFFNTYFTGQKELSVMAAMGPSERAQFLSHVLGYERLRDAQRLLRERRSTIVAQMAGLRQGMPDPDHVARTLTESSTRVTQSRERAVSAGERRVRAQKAFDVVHPRWEEVQRDRNRQQELMAELRVAEGQQASLDRDRERIERELSDIAGARAEMRRLEQELAPYPSLFAEAQRLEVLAREEGRRQALLETQRALADELRKLAERRGRIETAPKLEEEAEHALEAKRLELEDVHGQLEARRTEWVRDRQEAETKRQSLREQLAELKQQRDQLAATGEDGVCPTCTRPLGASLRSVLELLDGQIETVRVDGKYYKARVEQLMEMPEDLQQLDERRRTIFQEVGALERRVMKVQSAVAELAQLTSDLSVKEARHAALLRDLEAIPPGYDAERHEKVRAELERLSPLDARAARLSAQIEREPLLLRDRQNVLESLGRVVERLVDLQSRREASDISEAEYAQLRDRHDAAAEELRGSELALVSAEGDVRTAEQALVTAQHAAEELAQRQRALGELNAHKRLHDELDRAYTDLRTDLNFQLRPELSELASAFLSELTDGRYAELELDDQYNIIVLEEGVPKPVISGGEEDLANLVLRLAISQMIAERAGQSFSLLILDEIFGSLDELRRASVVDLLRHLQDRFEQVILITHIESVRDMLDHVIAVRYDEQTGASVVEQSDGIAEARDAGALGDARDTPLFEGAGAGD